MDLSGVVAISGKPGLFKVVSQISNGIIVEPLGEGKRMPVYAAEKVVALEDISIYTYEEDVPLVDVFEKMKEHFNGEKTMSHKEEPAHLKESMQKFLPGYDEERVYTSDIKKLFKWYNELADLGLLKEEEKKESGKKENKEKKTKAKKEKKSSGKESEKSKKISKPKAKKKTGGSKKKKE